MLFLCPSLLNETLLTGNHLSHAPAVKTADTVAEGALVSWLSISKVKLRHEDLADTNMCVRM